MLKKLAVIILFVVLADCASSTDKKAPTAAQIEKTAIEKAVREYYASREAQTEIEGFSYQKFDESIYLVGVQFKAADRPAGNVVARKFETAAGASWKIEPFNDRWKGILRMEPKE